MLHAVQHTPRNGIVPFYYDNVKKMFLKLRVW